ncbi:hypothetical protein D6D28_08614 [Aureobasidium pullulans]|uniref:Uncharacterized protein n=1 Tax=Aureobasidium pullulans TaxID=5580 RepID=A0A4S8S7D7_AURPU|nr:hypothetical protein D6D28_08614 [Aureobasidium pullulans]
MIYALINFNKLNLSTLNFNCLGFVHEKYQCKKTITIAANEKAKQILQNLELKGKKKSICCSIILLADACICQEHPRRPTAIVYAATGWLADLSITLGEEIKLAECSKCNVVTTSTNKDNITPVQQDKKVTSCFQKFLSQTQQLDKTIIDLRSDNTKLEGANSQLVQNIQMLKLVDKKQSYVFQQAGHEIRRLLAVITANDASLSYLTRQLTSSYDECYHLQSYVDELAARLANSESMANKQRATISTLQAKIALLEEKLMSAGLDKNDKTTLLENAVEAYQEGIDQAEDANDPLNSHVHQLRMKTTELQGYVQHKETIIMDVHSRWPSNDHESSTLNENSSWLSISGLRDSRLLTPPHSSCSSTQDTPQRD